MRVIDVSTAEFSVCPNQERLIRLVSGSLVESEAAQLFGHLDHCEGCQRHVDRLTIEQDHIMAAVRLRHDCPSDQDKRNAQNDPDAGDDPGCRPDPSLGHKSGVCHKSDRPDDEARLSHMIRQAQRLGRSDDTRVSGRSVTQAVSAADFVEGLRRSGLMPDTDLNDVLQGLGLQDAISQGDGSSVARALIEHRKLTPFQAKSLLRGRWKGLVLGNYAILERLGAGGMGSVFKARHTRMGRIVCLKVVNAAGRQSPEVIERFRNEARALAALSHPNIVVAHDANESKGVPYLVMEFIDGDDLAKFVRGHQPLSARDALSVAMQTAEALQYAHEQGVTHRDVKPHNIVATRDAESGRLSVKVLDLGLARFDSLISDNPDASVLAAMTNTGVVIGTVDYMAPEQALDSRHADARSDIYSLGCTLFFLLTGNPPFPGETVMQRLVAHREQPAPELWQRAGVSIDIEMVVHKMLAKRPEDRYQSMQEVLSEFRLLADGRIPRVASEPASSDLGTTLGPPVGLGPPPTMHAATSAGRPPAASILPPAASTDDFRAATLGNAGSPDDPTVTLPAASTQRDTDFVVNESPASRRRSSRHLAGWHVGNGATAVALLGIAAAAVMAAPIWNWIGPRLGRDRAIRNGGDGRALVIVGSEDFREDQFQSLAATLSARQVDVVAASANYGTGKSDYGVTLKSRFDNIRIDQASATDFDAIFVIGGTCTELTAQKSPVREEVVRLVDAALKNDVILTGCCEGWDVLKETHLIWKSDYRSKPKFQVHDADELARKAEMIFGKLQASRLEPVQ